MARFFKWTAIVVGLLLLLLATLAVVGIGAGNLVRFAGFNQKYETDPPSLPALKEPAVLIFSKTNGYRDDPQIKAANAALEEIARKMGWSSYVTENAAVFNPQQLSRFKTVVWSSVSGDVLTPEQRAAFRSWLENGGGYVALHGSGGDFSYKWRWYVDKVIGTQFIGHTIDPQIQQGTLLVEDRNHPATRHLPAKWVREDEWYSFAHSPRGKGYHVLVSLDENSYAPKSSLSFLPDLRMGKDHPMVWTHCVGKGRVFYSALGHEARAYSEPDHLRMIAGAIRWAGGDEGPGC